MAHLPLISIIIPAWNTSPWIECCLDSVLKQTYQNLEVIVVDDGSTDATGGIVDKYAKDDCRILVLHQSNQGLSAARNQGIKLAQGKYIAFVDSDDWVEENAYLQLSQVAEDKNADIVLGDLFYYVQGKIEKRARNYFFNSEDVLLGKECFVKLINIGNYSAMVCMNLYRTEFLRKNHLYFEQLYHEDEYFTPYAYYYAERVIDLGKAFYYYRQRTGSIMHSVDCRKRVECVCAVVDRLFQFVERKMKEEELYIVGAFLFRAIFLYMSATWGYVMLLREKSEVVYLPPLDCYKLKSWREQFGEKEFRKLEQLYFDLLNRERRLVGYNQFGDFDFLKYA